MRRLLLLALVAAGLSPGLLWRDDPPPPNASQSMTFTALPFPVGTRVGGPGGPLLNGAWQMRSANTDFDSWSALVPLDRYNLLSISDRGHFLRFPVPGTPKGAGGPVAIGRVLPGSDQFKTMQDMESATRDPASGRVWIGLEFRQSIMRFEPGLRDHREIRPPEMRDWPANGGPESLARLPDGRFLVLAEDPPRHGAPRPGLVFPGDPVTGVRPQQFLFSPPPGYSPSDMALLPDGRVLILLRGLRFFPPAFAIRLVLADPADIRPGREWKWRDVGPLAAPIPIDNYEGLAVTGGEHGAPLTLWMVSDDNQSRWLQRSLLLRFEWVPPAPD